jgi:hypothetical protein
MSGAAAGSSSRNRQNGSGRSGSSTRGGQKTDRSPTMRGMPLTSSGAIWVPSRERHSSPAWPAICATLADLPTPGGDSSSRLWSAARQRISAWAWLRVTVSASAGRSVMAVDRAGVQTRYFSES